MSFARHPVAALSLLLAGCATAAPSSPPFAEGGACLVGPAEPWVDRDAPITVVIDAIPATILFPTSIEPGANSPASFVARHTSETLVRVDCRGRVVQGLAMRWDPDSTKTRWFLRLRPGARFADGTRVSPKAVAELLADRWGDGALVPWADLRMARTSGDTGLVLVFDSPVDDLRILAAPSLALQGPPRGPGRTTPEVFYDSAGATLLPRSGPAVRIRFEGSDLRDAVDAGVDLIVSPDPAVVDYAESTGRYHTEPLPWQTIYLVVVPTGAWVSPAPALSGLGGRLIGGVRMSAREAQAPFWWMGQAQCPLPRPAAPSGLRPNGAVVYPGDDPSAKDIAERLVALVGTDQGWTAAMRARTSSPLEAMALDRGEYVRRIRAGRDAAYVVALPSTVLAPCLLLQSIHSLAPWLRSDGDGWAEAFPVVETRSYALLSSRVAGRVARDWGGALRLRLSER